MRVIGYSYEAAIHCVPCTQDRFPELNEETEDAEGNPVHPIFSTDELPEGDEETCDDCLDFIR